MNVHDCGEFTKWPIRKDKKINKNVSIKTAKIKGLEHISHKGKTIPARNIGEDCKCKRFKCFEVTSIDERKEILSQFNDMDSKNQQDAHLAGLIGMNHIGRHRPRVHTDINKPHCASYSYKLRIAGREKPICLKAFAAIHGITLPRIKRIQLSLVEKGCSPRDLRGKHNNRPRNYSKELVALIMHHITTYSPRQSHYSRRKNPEQLYLPAGLTIKYMYTAFIQEYLLNIPYKIYWHVFKTKFNIKFGFPRSDTCADCDRFQHCLSHPDITDEEKARLLTEKELHQRKADAFHTKKRGYKVKAKAGDITCLSFDFMQNLPLPHIPSNPVFFARQLWYYVFGIHDLGTDQATMYTYYESQAKKGANDVISMLLHYFNNNDVCKTLVLISDGCPGQNKNYTMLNFLYMLVHGLKVFDSITYIFPVRGHSYLPNDQDFSLIEKKKRKLERVEIPEEWDSLILQSRVKPSPFQLVKVDSSFMFDLKVATQKFFLKNAKPAIKIKGVRMFKIDTGIPFVKLRDSYSGPWRSSLITSKIKIGKEISLRMAYDTPVAIQSAKLENVEKLVGLLHKQSNRKFYDKLFQSQRHNVQESNIIESDNDDNSSACED